MLFSRACEYGIRAVLHLAASNASGPVLVREIAEALRIPSPFLSKVAQLLTRQGLLVSRKGPGGGLSLARSAESITLKQVVEAIDGPDLMNACILGIPECSDDAPCPLHEHWGGIRKGISHMLENQSILDVGKQLREQGWVLTRDWSIFLFF